MDITTPIADSIAAAIRDCLPYPSAKSIGTLEEAFRLLPAIVQEASGSGPIGLKAGLTDARQQSQFGLAHPLFGCLYANSQLATDVTLPFKAHVFIECEVGVQVNRQGQVKTVMPAVEFVRLDFESPATVTGVDLVLANLGAYKFMAGTALPWSSLDLKTLEDQTLELRHNGVATVNVPLAGLLSQARQTGEWVARESVRHGLDIPDSGLILTGTCGIPTPADIGNYEVRFGSLGSLGFCVTAD